MAMAVSTSGKSGLTSRRPSSITAVSRVTASASVASAGGGLTTSRSIGWPNCTSADDRRATLSGNERPTGTMVSPSAPAARAPSAMRAAPVLIGSSRGRSWVVPSGKMATTSPPTRAWWHSSKAISFPAAPPLSTRRWTNTTPARLRSHPATGTRRKVALATKRGVRPIADVISTGSMKPLKWLATSTTGRPLGTRAGPATSTRRNRSDAANLPTQAITRRTRPPPPRQSRGPSVERAPPEVQVLLSSHADPERRVTRDAPEGAAAATAAAPGGHVAGLDGARAIATLSVFFFHALWRTPALEPAPTRPRSR